MIGRNKIGILPDAVLIQWANGKIEACTPPDSHKFRSHVGWYAEIGQHDEFDRFARDHANRPRISIRHARPGGGVQVVQHWDLGREIRFFPLTKGPVALSVAESVAPSRIHGTADAGIGIRWGHTDTGRSTMALRGYLQVRRASNDSNEAGWMTFLRPVQIVVRSRMSDALLRALIDHIRVCEHADAIIERSKHPDAVSCFEIALPLGPGQETAWGKTAVSYVVPIASLHPADIDKEYLRKIWRPDAVVERALHDWPAVREWAFSFVFGEPRPPLLDGDQVNAPSAATHNGVKQRTAQ